MTGLADPVLLLKQLIITIPNNESDAIQVEGELKNVRTSQFPALLSPIN